MKSDISLDLVICTHNNAALLDRTLEAISQQQVPPGVRWRVLVVNNNCTDDTVEVVEGHVRSGRFPLRMVSEPNQGLTPARVCGVRNTEGDWIAFIDDDCLLTEDWIEQATRFALERPECGAFGGRVILQWETPPPPYVRKFPYAYAGKYHGETAKRRNSLPGAGMVVRRAALEACGWTSKQFLEDRAAARLVSGGDVEIGLRIAATRYQVWYNPAFKLRHVIPERRMSRSYLRRIVFGLGASRHNARALTWRGSYPAWLLYSAIYSVAFAVLNTAQAAGELSGSRSHRDVASTLSPARGWWSAMWGMLWMNPAERRQLLGCAASKAALGEQSRRAA